MKLDILIISAHPDDAELCCSGTIARHVANGKKVGMLDLTQGELGTRGTPEIRLQEAQISAGILGAQIRENLGFQDGFFRNDTDHQTVLIEQIRRFQPDVVLTNAPSDRHPDHGRASALVKDACFLSGLRKFNTIYEQMPQEAHRPAHVFHYIQNNYIEPHFVVDISKFWATKLESIKAFKSQFYNPESNEPESFISTKDFSQFIESRARVMGHKIGVSFGEGFIADKMIGVRDFDVLL